VSAKGSGQVINCQGKKSCRRVCYIWGEVFGAAEICYDHFDGEIKMNGRALRRWGGGSSHIGKMTNAAVLLLHSGAAVLLLLFIISSHHHNWGGAA
jgi:hypothetical protein